MSEDWSDTPEGWHKREFLMVRSSSFDMKPLAEDLGVPTGWVTDHFDQTSLSLSEDDLEKKRRALKLKPWLAQWSLVICVGRPASQALGVKMMQWEDFDGVLVGGVPVPSGDWYMHNRGKTKEYLGSLGVLELVKPGHKCWLPPDEVVWSCPFCGQDWMNGQRHG